MTKGIFICGTDTGVGKTTASIQLMRQLQHLGYRVAGMKPVASGCKQTPNGLANEDALALMEHASIQLPYSQVNPYAFEPAIAPHIAAQLTGQTIEIQTIIDNFKLVAAQVDVVIVEGVGGWLVPINQEQSMADLVLQLAIPTILVSGIRLGCLNHTLLTTQAIQNGGVFCAAWIANRLNESDHYAGENIAYLRETLPYDYLGEIPYQGEDSKLHLNSRTLAKIINTL